jgi:hypothetical protein
MNLDDDLEEFMSWATEYIHRTIRSDWHPMDVYLSVRGHRIARAKFVANSAPSWWRADIQIL